MKAEERRKGIINYMLCENSAVSGSKLAEMFGVSRQIIVQDISVLKAKNYNIISTHNGYVIQCSPMMERVFKVYHTKEDTQNELNTIVDFGGIVSDVFVWHKVYGRVEAELNIASKQDISRFLDGVRTGKSSELMNITGGYHYHTVRAESKEILDKIEHSLNEQGYIVPEI